MKDGLRAALVDVGGTLWPNTFTMTDGAHRERLAAVEQALGPDSGVAGELIDAIVEAVEEGAVSERRREADAIIGRALGRRGLASDEAGVRRVRQALCVHLGRVISPFDGSDDLLAGIKQLGLACVILSNTTFRDAEMYERDFAALGWDRWIDGCVTSVDVGCGKPDVLIFNRALDVAGAAPGACVMIGNSEEADIVPARRLGMGAIRVAIEEPRPPTTEADATVDSLADALGVLRAWCGPRGA